MDTLILDYRPTQVKFAQKFQSMAIWNAFVLS